MLILQSTARGRRRLLLSTLGVLVAAALMVFGLQAKSDPQQAAGAMTVGNRTSASFEQAAGGLSTAEVEHHAEADLVFDRTHVPLTGGPGAGLGPQFVAQSCVSCHVRNGRGRANANEALVRVAASAGLGPQIQDKAVLGAQPEASVTVRWRPVGQGAAELRRPDVALVRPGGDRLEASVARSLRVAPPLLGLGLLEAAILLHDGRARSLEEAILWHGGEAEASRQAYLALKAHQRQSLLQWLRQL